MYIHSTERDELRAKFTKWMENVVRRTRGHYLAAQKKQIETIPLDEISDERPIVTNAEPLEKTQESNGFDFEKEWLEDSFLQLSARKQQVLTLLFVHGMNPEEVAAKLDCSVQNVYNQRSLAIKQMKATNRDGKNKW